MLSLKRENFLKLLKQKKGRKEGLLILKSNFNKEKEIRLGIFISKKICKKAVWRNKIKRRIKEILRKREKKIEKGKDLLFIALPGIEKKNFSEIEKMVEKLLLKEKLLK